MNPNRALADRIDALLPQTHCGQCDYPGCRPYAEAVASGETDINRCPPGGQAGVDALARLLGRPSQPLDTTRGETKPLPDVAVIREAECIGCTLCIQACPVDAIVGASKQMHTVIEAECTGCELCLPPCPVDCIDMAPLRPFGEAELQAHRDMARIRYRDRNARRARDRQERDGARRQRQQALETRRQAGCERPDDERTRRRDAIAAAVARSRQRHQQPVSAQRTAPGRRPPAIAAAIERARAAQAQARGHSDRDDGDE